MAPTPLALQLLEQSNNGANAPRLTDYRGAATIARFSDPQAELEVMQSGCGIYDLGFLLRTELTGKDRVRWLNGMITNNIRDLAVGHGVYAFLLNPQGQIQGDLHAYKLEDSILIDTDRGQAEATLAKLKRYIIMDDVKMNSLGETVTAVGVSGPKARAVLIAAGIAIPETEPLQIFTPQCSCDCDCLQCTVIRGEDSPRETYEIWIAPQEAGKTWRALVAAGATRVGAEAQELWRIVSAIPLYGVDILERELPQETGQTRALNFTKGCYIGQEIVERIRARGHVNRTFTGFLVEGTVRLAPGTKIAADGKDVGELTSAATFRQGSDDRTLALGYIRRETATPGREVMIGETRATVAALPLDFPKVLTPEVVAAHS
jgi:folate-binding protein YgfZ